MNILDIENLSCGYTHRFTLKSVSLQVNEGDFIAIVGPNGSGKTTLFRGITGMLPFDSGDVKIRGESLNALSFRERARRIAVVNQTVNAGDISVEDYVLMGRTPYRETFQFFENATDIKIAEENLQLTGIWEKRDKLMNQLSGGEQQLAAIARALTQQTGIILLDEPTAHLDIAHQMKILQLTRQLNREKRLTVLLIIHDLNLASEFSDHLILLNRGQVFTEGLPSEVLTAENIKEVYHTNVLIQPNPVSGKPYIFPLPENN